MEINGLKLRGKNIDVSVDGEKFHVTVNGKEYSSNLGHPVKLPSTSLFGMFGRSPER